MKGLLRILWPIWVLTVVAVTIGLGFFVMQSNDSLWWVVGSILIPFGAVIALALFVPPSPPGTEKGGHHG